MIFKTRGIVLNHIKFKETSIIARIYTEEFGLQSYIVNGVRSSKGHAKIALYQPLMLLDLVVYKNDQKTIQRISEAKCDFAYKTILSDVRKSAIAMFWGELLNKTITDEGLEDREKFEFIRSELIRLEGTSEGVENLPLIFSIRFCRYLGFAIQDSTALIEDIPIKPSSEIYKLKNLFDAVIKGSDIPKTDSFLRRKGLNYVLNYYGYHIEDLRKLKSIDILKQVFL